MKVAVLTSSRADYGIYQPLLSTLENDPEFDLELIIFGTHLSELHGRTISMIEEDGYKIFAKVPFLAQDNSLAGVSTAIAENIKAFVPILERSDHDIIFALGDRFEMFAAVTAAFTQGKKIAHLHGGETTLGAIDNAFRHSITHMSAVHFTGTEAYRQRVIELTGSDQHVFNVGALSVDNMAQLKLLNIEGFKEQFDIDLSIPTVLITFHPETIDPEKNPYHVHELLAALEEMSSFQQVITMPNADPMGNMIRKEMNAYIASHENAIGVENFGALGYLSCMKHCAFMIGNTSSAFAEASFFPTPVINLGRRQEGRIRTPNILDVEIKKDDILGGVGKVDEIRDLERSYVYGNGRSAENIVAILRELK